MFPFVLGVWQYEAPMSTLRGEIINDSLPRNFRVKLLRIPAVFPVESARRDVWIRP
jgi:hypothetical protein